MADPREAAKSRTESAWRPGEFYLREQEIKSQRRGSRLQALTAVAALAAALAAVYVSLNASRAIEVAEKSVQRQAEESRLNTAVSAIREGPVAQRIAGLTLLRREVTQKLQTANESGATKAERSDALSLFRGTLGILASYVKNPVGSSPSEAAPLDERASAPELVGQPHMGDDALYALADIKLMLSRKSLFKDVRGDPGELSLIDRQLPALDLAGATLYHVDWRGVDTSWLTGHFNGIDLRTATLDDSRWNGSNLHLAFLRCATLKHARFNKQASTATNLTNADLRRATLKDADLRNADLTDANLEGAELTGAKLAGAKIAGATLRGVKIDSGVQKELKKAEGYSKAVGVGEPSLLAPSDTAPDLECAAPE